MKTLIAVPCMDQVAAPFAQSLATIRRVGESMVSFLIGSLVWDSRNALSKIALQTKADYVLWLDSDMIFPSDVMEKMIKHMKDGKDIVSGLYFKRRPPFEPVIYKTLTPDHAEKLPNYPRDTVFEVEGVGLGCCMMSTKVLRDILLDGEDWFSQIGNFGEDLSFCLRAKKLGYKIYCDSTIKCGHIGQVIVDEGVWDAQSE